MALKGTWWWWWWWGGGGGGYERKGGRKKGQGIGERRKGTAFPSFLSDTTRDFGSQRNPRGR